MTRTRITAGIVLVTSSRAPGRANAGSSAVTMTAATFSTLSSSPGTRTSILDRMFANVCVVNSVCCLSPVLLRPTTRP